MRRAALLVLAIAPAGCFSASSGGGSPDANFNTQSDAEFTDSGTSPLDASVDASADVAVDSSTKDVTVLQEAAVDAGFDAPVEAAAPQPVTVVVTNALGPEQNVPVVFTDSNGTTEQAQMTGVAGTASSVMAAGGQATVVMGSASQPYLFTVEGVAAGDLIAVYDPAADVAYDGQGVSVDEWPDAAPPGTAEYAGTFGPCDTSESATPPLTGTIQPGCEAAGHFPMLLTAVNSNGLPTGYTWQKGNALPPDGGVANVDLTNPWTTSTDTLTLTASSNADTLAFAMLAGGVAQSPNNNTGTSAAFTYPGGFPDALQAEANLYQYGNGVSISAIATRLAPPVDGGTVAADLTQLLPSVVSSQLNPMTLGQPIISWSVGDAGTIASASGVVVSFVWNDNTAVWTIVAPPTATQVQAPALPAAYAGWAPPSTGQFASPPTVAIVQASFFAGYAGLRAQAGTAGLTSVLLSDLQSSSNGYFNGPIVPPLPVNGTLEMTAITQPGD